MDKIEWIELLKKTLPPLLLEKKMGCTNKAVYGGFHSFMEKNLLLLKEGILGGDKDLQQPLGELQAAYKVYPLLKEDQRRKIVEDSIQKLSLVKAKASLSLWDLPLSSLKGVGGKRSEQLARLGLTTIGDLFYLLPRYYDDRRRVVKIPDLLPDFQHSFTLRGKILHISSFRAKGGFDVIRATIDDGCGKIDALWFNQPYLAKTLKGGQEVYLQGRLNKRAYQENRVLELSNPLVEKEGDEPLLTRRLLPMYPVTKGLSQKEIQRITRRAREEILPYLQDPLPQSMLKNLKILGLREAIEKVHHPRSTHDMEAGRRSLAFLELLLEQMSLFERRLERRGVKGISHSTANTLLDSYLTQLPFQLTPSQREVFLEIKEDMQNDRQMSRLLQGDVGSGKTVIAALSLLKAIEGGFQGALMAPTEILAHQHYLDLQGEFKGLGIEVGFLAGGGRPKEMEEVKDNLAKGTLQLVVGTHSLFQEGVFFKNLGLVIIDEQHRFGVKQRSSLVKKGISPDLLVMTATPIPRSLAMTLYGDLDISIIKGLPPNRRPITTRTHRGPWEEIKGNIFKELQQGNQVYYVCPLIQENQDLNLGAVEERFGDLVANFHPYSVAVLHGGMNREEKFKIMEDFQRGLVKILLATTVIEVGVNNPKATLIVIEDAHRFGLSQLHQLRGRVGRGDRESQCLLLWKPVTPLGEKRLLAMLECGDGFQLAEEDLKLRGPGEFLGERQHGLPKFQMAKIPQDLKLLREARHLAQTLVEKGLDHPSLLFLRLLLDRKKGRPV